MSLPWILAAALCVVISGFYSGSETGLYCLNRLRLRLGSDAGHRGARLLRSMLADEQGLIVVTLIGTNLFNYLATVCVARVFTHHDYSGARAELYTTLIVAPILSVFAELLPKNLYERHPDRLSLAGAWSLLLSSLLYRTVGLVWALKWLARAVSGRLQGWQRQPMSFLHPRQEMISLLREGVGEGTLSQEQSRTVDRVMNLGSLRIGAVMIPLARVVAVPIDSPRAKLLQIIRRSDYSRLPVYRGEPRNVVGIVNVYDVLQDESDRPIESLMRPPLRLQPDQSVMSCLFRMQRSRQPMAVIEARPGRAVGIVTIKDLVEQIVGELRAW